MNTNEINNVINSNISTIKLFDREERIEKIINSYLYETNCCYGFNTYSISIYLDKLNEKINSYNSDKFGKVELIKFLKYRSNFNHHINTNTAQPEIICYLEKLNNFISNLKERLGIKYLPPYKNNIIYFIESFIELYFKLNSDLKSIEIEYSPYAKKREYGLIIHTKPRNYIYVENNNDITCDLKSMPTCVIYRKDIFQQDKHCELISHPSVNMVVSFDDDHHLEYYHKLHINSNYSQIYRDITSHLMKFFDSKNMHISNLINKIYKLTKRLAHFEDDFNYKVYRENKHKFEYEVKALKSHNQSIIFELKELDVSNQLIIRAEYLTDALGSLQEKYFNYNSIDVCLHSSLSTIKKNRFLYRGRSKGTLFSEENLSAILKTMLELKINHDSVFVTQEEINGAGFSDIEIKIGHITASIIECKLLKKKEGFNMESSLAKGLDQILYRYSRPLHQYFNMPPKLFLVLFCVDPEWNDIRKKTNQALEGYSQRNNFKVTYHESYNSTTLSTSLEKESPHFGTHFLNLDIIICELEDNVDADRTNIKPYYKNK